MSVSFYGEIGKISPIAMGLSVSVCLPVRVWLSVKIVRIGHTLEEIKNDSIIALCDLDLLFGEKNVNGTLTQKCVWDNCRF